MKGISGSVTRGLPTKAKLICADNTGAKKIECIKVLGCLLYTSPSPRDVEESRMPSSA